MQSVFLGDSSVSESCLYKHGLQKGGLSLWTVTLLGCHKQLVDNSNLLTGSKKGGEQCLKAISTSEDKKYRGSCVELLLCC